MNQDQMKISGIVCMVICAVCIFIAIERYNTNANNVQGMNAISNSGPFRSLTGGVELKPATPAATKYALFFALITGGAGAFLLTKSKNNTGQNAPEDVS